MSSGRILRFLVVATVLGGMADASTPPSGFSETQLVGGNAADGASRPTAIAYEPGTGNLWVTEKGDASGTLNEARVRVRPAGGGEVSTALTLPCVDHFSERGLLAIAFDPDYLVFGGAHRYVYLYYTRIYSASGTCNTGAPPGVRNRLSRFKEQGRLLRNEEVILEGPYLSSAGNHNGGSIRFAADKTLFLSMGDNDTDADANPASRDLNDLKGKLLRINADGSIPGNNPFVGQPGVRPEIWAWGLRNPFRFTIDPLNGNIYIGDVGENTWEEIDLGVPGGDYGYPCFEGPAPFRSCDPAPSNPRAPIYAYRHDGGTPPVAGATVIGGPVYRGTTFPAEYRGRYFFGDFISGWIRSGVLSGDQLTDVQMFVPDATTVVDMAVSPAGCLTWASLGSGVRNVCFSADFDGDGFNAAQGDCNDTDPTSYPGGLEVCDGNDNDCSGGVPSAEQDPDGDGRVACAPWNDVQGDNPTILGGGDNCPAQANPSQADYDGDGIGDACESGVDLADIDQSSRVDGFDLARLARAFASACGDPAYDAASDLDRSCAIDGEDLALFAPQFGKSRPGVVTNR